jgi:hypothetical protein
LTAAAAMATLVVVGAILAGPAILDCSRTPGGFGACLRDRLDPTPVTPPAPPLEDGWLDANANEYAPPASPPVELEASTATLSAADLPSASVAPAEVAIAPPAVDLAIASPAPDSGTASIALIGPQGTMAVEATPVPPAASSAAPEPLVPAPDLAIPVAPPSSEPAPVVLSAEPSSEPPQPEPSVEPAPSSEPPTLTVEFNPTYPNVIVLPAPLTGDDSAFRSLQLN